MIKINLNPPERVLGHFAWIAIPGLPLVVGAVLRIAGVFAWGHPALLAAGGVAVAQLALYLAGVRFATKAVYVLLSLIAMPIGFVLSHVLMAVIYYLVMTPIGLFFRLVGRDVLGRKLEPNKASYWHDRGEPRSASNYFKLY